MAARAVSATSWKQLRQRREQQTGQYDLGSFMDEVRERLDEIVGQEREGIDWLRSPDRPDAPTDAEMREMVENLARRKQEALDSLPDDAAGKLRASWTTSSSTRTRAQPFQDLVNELRQKMLGDKFQNMQQALESMTQGRPGADSRDGARAQPDARQAPPRRSHRRGLPRVHGPLGPHVPARASKTSTT